AVGVGEQNRSAARLDAVEGADGIEGRPVVAIGRFIGRDARPGVGLVADELEHYSPRRRSERRSMRTGRRARLGTVARRSNDSKILACDLTPNSGRAGFRDGARGGAVGLGMIDPTTFTALQAFRAGVYECFGARRDALFELLDA